MAAITENYKLTKQQNSEKVNVALINANMDIIDNALHELSQSSPVIEIEPISSLEIQKLFKK